MRGEPGIGKTALLGYCEHQAEDCRVVHVAGVEDELVLPFAALHQLCRPLLDHLSGLPEPQARGLQVAFGLSVGTAPDRFMVGLAVLSVLADVASEGCSSASSTMLSGSMMRPHRCSDSSPDVSSRNRSYCSLSYATTGERHLFDRLPTLSLEGLTYNDATALITATTAGRVDARVRDRIVAETRGNPLALLELPRVMSRTELVGGFAVPWTDTLSGQMHEHYVRRIGALPEQTRQMLTLAAADPTGDSALFWRAGLALGLDPEAAGAAESDQLLEVGSHIRFRHPLARSAAYAAGSDADRRAAHAALAAATDARRGSGAPRVAPGHRSNRPGRNPGCRAGNDCRAAQARGGIAAAAAVLERSSG